ncbi:MAG TPA: helix-turn-helix domain-containing protein [Tepidisphaeraceae bacterium]|jgi:DNA-binding XRE family transcriptional regulator|nr:helix-turn-helix domain-containing protein [Tepidisphaeraceae bacterium]
MKKASSKSQKTSPIEAFLAFSDEEKEAVYRSVDREIPLSETRPLTAAQRELWEHAKRKVRGRPEVGASMPDANGNYPAIAYGRALLARRIVAARNLAGWTQAELARRAGLRKETIHRIEAGKNNPDESTFAKIEKAFGAAGVTV